MATLTTEIVPSAVSSASAKSLPVESLRLGSPDSLLKDVRAYEHERQHAKKGTEVARLKKRKDNSSLLKLGLVPTRSPRMRTAKKARFGVKAECAAADHDVDPDRHESPIHPISAPFATNTFNMEVNLADLVKPKKARKVKESADFEVVPRVRAVIALDEFPRVHNDLQLGESWEYVQEEEQSRSHQDMSSSYAQVAANSQ